MDRLSSGHVAGRKACPAGGPPPRPAGYDARTVARPSEPLLALLRDVVRQKGFTTASLAERLRVDRARLKHQLSGAEPLTVDDFILLSQALELTPEQLGLPSPSSPTAPTTPPAGTLGLATVPEVPQQPGADAPVGPDPLGNLPRQVLELGFALGIDLFLLLDPTLLGECGVPATVVSRFPDALPIKLEARFHRHNRPRFLDDAFECVLSFDRLYTCTFPWVAFKQVTFNLPTEEAQPPAEPPKPAGPHLRLVK